MSNVIPSFKSTITIVTVLLSSITGGYYVQYHAEERYKKSRDERIERILDEEERNGTLFQKKNEEEKSPK